jgi:hypothetical protein
MSENKYPSELAERFQIRMPEGLRGRIREAADDANRSMNAEIIHILAEHFESKSGYTLKLELPPELYKSLLNEALLRDQSMEERAVDVLAGDGSQTPGIDKITNKLDSYAEQLFEQRFENIYIRREADESMILYFNKVIQLNQFVSSILRSHAKDIDGAHLKMARELKKLTDVEIKTFSGRVDRLKETQADGL